MPSFDFDYRPVTLIIPAGETRIVQALAFLALATATSAVEIAPSGKAGTFGPFALKQTFESPDGVSPIGTVAIRNPTGAPVTITLVTSNKRIVFSPSSSAQSVTLDGVTVTVPVSIAASVPISGVAAASERVAVADGAAVAPTADLEGRLVVAPHAPIGDRLGGTVVIAAAGAVDLIAAQAAGFRAHLTSLVISNDGGADNVAIILDGATELFRVAVKAGDSKHLTFPVPEHTTAATALRVNITGATSMRIRARAYKGV